MKDLSSYSYPATACRKSTLFATVLVILSIVGAVFSTATVATAADTVSLVVKLVDGLTPTEQAAVIARNGGVETSSISALRLHVVTVAVVDQPQVQLNYQSDPQVVSVELNMVRKAEAVPADANYGVQWALSKIGWELVFGTVTPKSTAKLALLDTGIDASHPDLVATVIPGISILDGSNGLSDPSGHGTWLAGIAVAATDNGTGIAGVAFSGVKIMPVNVLNAGGIGQDSDIIAGIIWAVDNGADVILMGFSNPDFSQNLQDAIDYAWSKGAVLVSATGNDGVSTNTFPAGDRGVIGVSATDPNDFLSPASNYGQDTFLAAPGTDIYTTSPNGSYAYISGTSASSAFVAGTAAFMKAVDPTLTNGIIVGRLARSADAIGTAGDPNNTFMFGNGRLNMANALADTGIDPVQPAGTPGGGGPYVGPYAAAVARHFDTVSVEFKTGTPTYGTASNETFLVTVKTIGSGSLNNISLSVTGLPTGTTGIFSPVTISGSNGTPSPTSTLTINTSATTPAGSFTFVVSATAPFETIKTATGTLLITPASLTVKADAKTKEYGAADPSLTYSASGFVNGDTSISILTGSLARVAGETVADGPYAISQGSLAATSNYTIAFTGANLTINKHAVTVAADAKSKTYGDADPVALSYKITSGSLVGNDAFSGALSRATGEAVGSYAIEQSNLALSGNYDLTYVGANFSITKRAVTVTADAKSKTYGDSDPALTYQITSGSLVTGDAFSGALIRVAGEAAGSYAIEQSTLALNGNYDLSYVGANFSITKRAVTVTADANSKTYGDSDPALTYKITSGSLVGSDAFTGALIRATGDAVGSYAIQQSTLALSGNYDLSYLGANFSITKRAVTVTADAKSKTYGDSEPALTYKITSGSLVGSDAFSGALIRATGDAVGSYAILQNTLALSGNYDLSYVGANFSITKRAVTVTADAKSKTYGDSDPALTYKITIGSLVGSDAFSGVLSRVTGEAVGSYAIQQSTLALSGNYDLSYVGANFSITKRAVTVTADAKSKTYGDSDPALTYQITIGSLVTGDAFSGALIRATGDAVGSYAIQQSTLALSGNYDLSYVGANFSITKRAVTITADAKSKTYGDSEPALTYQITSGSLVTGDAFSGALIRATGDAVGSYAIQQSTLALSGNYDLTYVGANFSITKRAVTVTADAKSKTYGDSDPVLTYQITGGSLVTGDAFSGALIRATGDAVGSYAIQQNTLALSVNYDLSYVGANFSITKRAVTVTADAKSRTYGDSDPALTYQITGGSLVTGDTFSGALSRTTGDAFSGTLNRAAGDAVGSYAIQQSTLALSGNYDLAYVGANFSITKRAVTVAADAKSKTYGDSEPALTYKITSGSLVTGDAFSGALNRAAGENVGQYDITQGTLVLTNNYTLNFTVAKLNIIKKTASVIPTAAKKILGASDPVLAGTLDGFLASDNVTATYSRIAGETVGSYVISATLSPAGILGNYEITYKTANFNIYFNWTGYLQPINDTAHQTGLNLSSFKAGQTIPAKFVLTNAVGAVVIQTGNPTFTRSNNLGSCSSDISPEDVQVITPDTTPVYMWDGSQYHYNWSTKGLSSGLYRIYANLGDGSSQWVDICLTK